MTNTLYNEASDRLGGSSLLAPSSGNKTHHHLLLLLYRGGAKEESIAALEQAILVRWRWRDIDLGISS